VFASFKIDDREILIHESQLIAAAAQGAIANVMRGLQKSEDQLYKKQR
jgi:hypothetical protein